MKSFSRIVISLLMVAGSCSGGENSLANCTEAMADLVRAFQAYIDRFAGISPQDFSKDGTVPSSRGIVSALGTFRARVRTADCDPVLMRDQLQLELAELKGQGIMAETIATSMRAKLMGALTARTVEPQVRRVKPSEDLREVAASVVPGSRLILEEGDFRINKPLVLFEPITITGQGKDVTRIVSGSEGADVIFLGNGVLGIEDLTVDHEGDSASSLVVIRSGSYRIARSRFRGTKKDDQGGGIGLVVGADSDSSSSARQRTMSIVSSDFVDNAESGIVVAGSDEPIIESVLISRSGNCGICYIGNGSGEVRASTFDSNGAGIAILATSKPRIHGNNFNDNSTGIQVRDDATPSVMSNTFERTAIVAMVLAGRSGGLVRLNTCRGQGLGILITEQSAADVLDNDCPTTRA